MLLIENGEISTDSAEVILGLIAQISDLNTNKGTYEDITNSGNLNIISDFELKKSLVDYYITVDGVDFIDKFSYNYFNDFVMPFIFTEINVLKGRFVNPDVINTVQFSNVFAGYISTRQQKNTAYKDLLEKSYSLKDELLNN